MKSFLSNVIMYIGAFEVFHVQVLYNKLMAQLDGSESRDPHPCHLSCGRKLQCKQHTCPNLCHRGHCPPCMETIFTDLFCTNERHIGTSLPGK